MSTCAKCGAALLATGHCPACMARLSLGESEPEENSRTLGGCEVFEEIGRGGMGVVYRARQTALGRDVALKMLLAGEFASPEFRARFRQEAEVAARLRHPGIVTIHEIGEDEGQLFFTMELVAGRSLGELSRGVPLPARDAATHLRIIADAVHYAHSEGVLHRDLKPANILVDSFGQPRVADFGLARIERGSMAGATPSAHVLGSPPYLAPEVAEGDAASVSSDVYALGAVLYHLLTGRAPFHGENVAQILAQVREGRIIAPRRLNPAVPRDLDAICLKALEHSPSRRYASAAQFSSELVRWLAGEPVLARNVGPIGRMWRWACRKPALAAALAVVVLAVLAAGVIFVVSREKTLRAERHRAEVAEQLAGERLRAASLAQAQRITREHVAGHRAATLAVLREAWRVKPGADLRDAFIDSLALPDLALEPRPANTTVAPEQSVNFSPPAPVVARADHAGRGLVAAVGEDRTIAIYDAATGAVRLRLPGHDGFCESLAFSPRGDLLASKGSEGTLRLWDSARGDELCVVTQGLPDGVRIQWSPDGRWIALGPRHALRVTDAALERIPPLDSATGTPDIQTLAFSRDARWLAATTLQNAHLWSLAEGRHTAAIATQGGEWTGAHFSTEPPALWLGGWNSALRSHTLANPSAPPHRAKGGDGGTLAAVSPDGTRLALLNNGRGGFLIYTPRDSEGVWLAHKGPFAIAFHPRDGSVITSSFDTPNLRIWPANAPRHIREIPADSSANLAFSPDGTRLFATWKKTLTSWDTASWKPAPTIAFHERIDEVAVSPDATLLAVLSPRRVHLRRTAEPAEPFATLPLPGVLPREHVAALCFSSDGTRLALQTSANAVLVWKMDALGLALTDSALDGMSRE